MADGRVGFRVALVVLIGLFAVAAQNLGRKPFWVDESIAVLPARSILDHGVPLQPFDLDFMPFQVIEGMWDPATPAYRYALAAFTGVFGFSEVTTRAFSLLLGLISVIVIGLAVREIWGRRVAWMSMLVLASSPMFMSFAREARHHTFVVATTGLVIAMLLRLQRKPDSAMLKEGWLPAAMFALLGHTMAWLLLPVLAWFGVVYGLSRMFRARGLRVALLWSAAALVFGFIVLAWHESLPFLHDVSCRNRPAACKPGPGFYFLVAFGFMSGWSLELMNSGRAVGLGASFGVPMFLVGLAWAIAQAVRPRTDEVSRRGVIFALGWLLLPLILLATQEVKFPRYLFVWFLPVAAALTALAVDRLAGLAVRIPTIANGIRLALLLVVCLWPFRLMTADPAEGGWRSGWWSYTRDEILHGSDDNWQQIRAQVEELKQRLRPGDVVVTSLDDASLRYYLDRPVYSFLNSRRNAAFFNGLLTEAAKSGNKVYYIDTLPHLNFCLAGPDHMVTVDCRAKFFDFYKTCTTYDPAGPGTCVRLGFPRPS